VSNNTTLKTLFLFKCVVLVFVLQSEYWKCQCCDGWIC